MGKHNHLPMSVAPSVEPNGCQHKNHGELRHWDSDADDEAYYGCLDCRTLAHGYECHCVGCKVGNHIRC